MELHPKIPTSSLDIGSYYAYVIEGLILIAFNGILAASIFATVLRSQKEYIIFATNMLFDAIFGLTYFSAGLYRMVFIYYKEECKSFLRYKCLVLDIPLSTKWMCFTTLHVICFVVITPGMGIIILISAIDRSISVFWPIKYIKLSTRYAYGLMTLSFICVLPTLIATAVSSSELDKVYDVSPFKIMWRATSNDVNEIYGKVSWSTTSLMAD